MTDKKISQLTNITGANLADTDEFVVVDSSADETKAITYGELKKFNGDVSFGDNDKAIFGAGSDLQIYHSGTHSFIDDAGQGNLYVRANNLSLGKYTGESYITTEADGKVELYYDNSSKLETTSTGIDVTGTVTADGLTVDGDIIQSGGDEIQNSGTLRLSGDYDASGAGDVEFKTKGILRQKIANGGSISFYDSAGSSQSFFWDASAESLGIGTTVPNSSSKLHVEGGAAEQVQIRVSQSDNTGVYLFSQSSASGVWNVDNTSLLFATNNAERMRIDSSGLIKAVSSITSDPTDTGAYWYNKSGVGPTLSGFQFSIRTGATPNEALRVDESGNLLVGTTTTTLTTNDGIQLSSDGFLHASRDGNISGQFNRINSDGDIVRFRKDGSTVGSIGSNASGGTPVLDISANATSGIMRMLTSGSEAMRIDTSGNLLVGTTDATLYNETNTSNAGLAALSSGQLQIATDGTEAAYFNRMSSDGKIAQFRKDGVEVGSISVTGSATSYNTSSDYRLKTDVQPMTGASARVQALNPVNFEWIADGSRVDGFLAHEAQAVVPEAVTGEKDGEEMQAIDQSKLVPLLTAALQEALTKINALEARITTLEG